MKKKETHKWNNLTINASYEFILYEILTFIHTNTLSHTRKCIYSISVKTLQKWNNVKISMDLLSNLNFNRLQFILLWKSYKNVIIRLKTLINIKVKSTSKTKCIGLLFTFYLILNAIHTMALALAPEDCAWSLSHTFGCDNVRSSFNDAKLTRPSVNL